MTKKPYRKIPEQKVNGIIFSGDEGSFFEPMVVDKKEQVKKLRQEASRLASLANKRVARLEKNGLKNSPAYQGYLKSGGGRFGVKGKTHNEVQAELARLRRFVDARTSTITGSNSYLKEIADNTNIKYSNMEELRKKADKFFELSTKVEEYLRTVEDMASAIGYQKIWEAVNTYTDKARIDLSQTNLDVDDMIEKITDALTEHQRPEKIIPNVPIDDEDFWFQLPKD